MENWTKVFSSSEVLQVKLAEDILKQNGIESHILHKPDSALPSIGDAELFTPDDLAEKAIAVLKENDFLVSEEE